MGGEKSTLLRQRMLMIGLHFGEIWRAVSSTMSRSPILLGEVLGKSRGGSGGLIGG